MPLVLTALRRHVLAFTAIFLILGGSAVAVAKPSIGGKSTNKIYACVTEEYRTLNLTTAKATCPSGQSKISWDATGKQGAQGKPGARGPAGAVGAKGDAGAAGAAGINGPVGAKGENGADGTAGANGDDGAPGLPGHDGVTGNVGPQGPAGDVGPQGPTGNTGPQGPAGDTGPQGPTGSTGQTGAQGDVGPQGPAGQDGVQGPTGPAGPAGPTGPTGPAAVSAFALFYALMPPDNAATVAPGNDVQFPQDGPNSGEINRLGPSAFNLAAEGVYRVSFSVPVTEAGQLLLTLHGADVEYTVVGRATGTSQIATSTIVRTIMDNMILTVRNPAGSSTALTVTPLAGGNRPVSATLTIERLQ